MKHSFLFEALIKAGPNLKSLQQVHSLILVTGTHNTSLSTLTKLINSACAAGSISYVRRLFHSLRLNPDAFLFNSIVKSCSKFKFPLHSLYFYIRMLISQTPPSSYTFTAVIKSCGDIANVELGRIVHAHVVVNGYGEDSFVQAALVSFYAKSGQLCVARKVFDEMPERSVVAWNAMISGYEQNGCGAEAISLFDRMREVGCIEVDCATLVAVLSACSQVGALELGCWVHDYVVRNEFEVNAVLGSALISMYCRCGSVGKARMVFDEMKERNVVAWTAMITGYGMHGYGVEALEIFERMKCEGLCPNYVTFIAVLSACAHAGLVQEGRKVIISMRRDYRLAPGTEHHVCVVDMLGRAGFLDEAFRYIKEHIGGKVAPAVWTAMLGACKMHKNLDVGVQAAEKLLSAEPENPSHYVLLSNIYALAGRMDRVEMVRNLMIRKQLKKQVGYTTIEVDHKTYLFSNGDKSHSETSKIYKYLDELMSRCKQAGYLPVPESVLHLLEEEEKEFALRYHSEKLAIAFGLLNTEPGSTIRIVKNLRMCEDCHSAIKSISVVSCREIIVRDKLRFHHFKDGSCSCLDYW